MASWAQDGGSRQWPETQLRVCLACGARLQETLARLGSLRCLECREIDRPLDESLVAAQPVSGELETLAGAAATVRARVAILRPGEMSFSFLLRAIRGRQVSNP